MSKLDKTKKEQIIEDKDEIKNLESFIKKNKKQNKVLGKLLNNLNAEYKKKTDK